MKVSHFYLKKIKSNLLIFKCFKSESLQIIIQNTFYIFFVSKTEFDFSFSNQQSSISEDRKYRKDCNTSCGGLLVHVNQDLNCKMLKKYVMCWEISELSKLSWLIIGSYKLPLIN